MKFLKVKRLRVDYPLFLIATESNNRKIKEPRVVHQCPPASAQAISEQGGKAKTVYCLNFAVI